MVSPTIFHDLVAQTPVRVIALAGSVSVIVQVAKVLFPKLLSGKLAIALNVVVSVAGIYVGMNPANFWSETTLAQVLMVAAAAAGVHGTAKSLSTTWAGVGVAPAPAAYPNGVLGSTGASKPWPTVHDPNGAGTKFNTTAADPQAKNPGAL